MFVVAGTVLYYLYVAYRCVQNFVRI